MKQQLRKKMLEQRQALSFQRRQEAQANVCKAFSLQFTLSYASFGTELDVWDFNRHLAKNNLLALPKVEGDNLRLYKVNDCGNLIKSPLGILEPNPVLCEEIDPSEIQLALIPGLAFDTANNRLGYGKGFYDRFLKNNKLKAVGIGFREQLTHDLLPTESHDVPLFSIYLG